MVFPPHFSLSELTATNKGISNVPNEFQKNNLLYIANKLEIIRGQFGKPIYINSAFRSPLVNKAVSGSPSSYHLSGLAVDISLHNVNYETFPKLLQYILDTEPVEVYPISHTALHIAWNPNKSFLSNF